MTSNASPSPFKSLYKAQRGVSNLETRRDNALAAQKTSRQAAVQSLRWGAADDLLSLSLSSDEEDEATKPEQRAQKRKAKRYQVYRDRLMSGESFEEDSLPVDLLDRYCVALVPKGKRCSVITYPSVRRKHFSHNTLLLSRVNAVPLGRFTTSLPPSCHLDCVWLADINLLVVLDILFWSDIAVADSDTEFRTFFRMSKFQELPPQPVPSPAIEENPRNRHLLVAPSIFFSSPLNSTILHQQLMPYATSQNYTLSIPVIQFNHDQQPFSTTLQLNVPIEGFLFTVLDALYENGISPLANWLPIQQADRLQSLL